MINIPLVSASAVDLTISVGLAHHGGALKVNEGPGNAGMGWSVVAGGYVTREVRGLPDDYNANGKTGWLYNGNAQAIQSFNPTANDDLTIYTDETADWTFINSLGYTKDPEPDVYYFSAPGISGKFVFGADGLPKLIPYQDLQITFASNVFTIKTNTGIIYTFGSANSVIRQSLSANYAGAIDVFTSTYNYFQTQVAFTSAWNLTKMESIASGASALYTYTSGQSKWQSQYFSPNLPDSAYFLKDIVNPKSLSQITLKNYSINITWSNQVVDKVSLTESETGDTREFDLVYKSITSASDTGSPTIARPFLMQVRQQASNPCSVLPSYSFDYTGVDTTLNKVNVPWRKGWGEDYFGYYNGQNLNQNLAPVYFYQNESGAKRFRFTPLPGVAVTQSLSAGTGGRDVNPAYTAYGSIQRIYYPSGGSTSFTYECNKYYDTDTQEQLFGPGVRVASVISSGGEAAAGKSSSASGFHVLTKSYQYSTTNANTVTSGKITYLPVFAFANGDNIFRSLANMGPASEVMYSRVRELTTGLGYRVYEYEIPNTYPDATATRSRIARTFTRASLFKNGAYTFPFAPLADWGFLRGYLARISEFTEGNQLTKRKRMVYATVQNAGSATIKGLRFEGINDLATLTTVFHYSQYDIPVNQSRLLSQEIVLTTGDKSDADSTTTTYSYNAKNMVVQIARTSTDNSLTNQYIKYSMDYSIPSPLPADVQATAISKLNATGRYGEVIETYQTFTPSGGTATVTGATLNLYKDYGTNNPVWPYKTSHLPAGATFTAAFASGGNFNADTDYLVDATIDYANGLPVNQTGRSLITSGVHYGNGTGLPIASFANCKAEHAVYDGFEMSSTRGLTYTGSTAPATPAGRTGNKSLMLTNACTLVTVSPVTKGENTYRISLWALAATGNVAIIIRAKSGTTTQSTLTLNYPTANQWTYLEGTMNTTSVSSAFTFEISSPTSIQLDDFVALPKSAVVSLKTYQPLTGITSQSDDRGNSTKVIYDSFGRKINTLDRNRNLVEVQEYGTQRKGKLELSAGFTSNVTQYIAGQTATFTAASSCLPGLTYTWTFTDHHGSQTTATGGSVVKAFPTYGSYSIQLVASATGYVSATMIQNICVSLPAALSLATQIDLPTTIYQCDAVNTRTRVFSAVTNGFTTTGMTVVYDWYIKGINDNDWVNAMEYISTTVALSGNTMTYASPSYNYQVRCYATVGGQIANGNTDCNYQFVYGQAADVAITFVPQSQCQ